MQVQTTSTLDRRMRPPLSAPGDLLGTLAEIEQLARQTQANIAAGSATSGVSGLKKIQERASDARRHAREATRA